MSHDMADASSLCLISRGESKRQMMDAREVKGLHIAATSHIAQQGQLWLVPSQSSNKNYTVNAQAQTCTCLDFETRQKPCKHLYAVQQALNPQPLTALPAPVKRPTYKQAWHEYNEAQTHEKAEFQALLYELCQTVEDPIQEKGRPRLSVADIIFSAAFKVYSTVSGRRFDTDLREAHKRGYIVRLPHYNSVFRYLEAQALTPYLHELIRLSSLALKTVETDFAVDSSGFSTGQFMRWLDVKYGQEEDRRQWLKVHLMTGVKTNIVTSVEISDGYAHDYQYFKPLVDKTARSGFQMKEVSADKAYLGADNLLTTLRHGAVPYIPFKTNSVASCPRHAKSTLWARMLHFYNFKRDEFLQHYHKRSNVETTFSMIKAKFGQRLRSKSMTAQINEALCKVLCHNLCVVIQSMHELGITATFEAETTLAPKRLSI
jgi:transposase